MRQWATARWPRSRAVAPSRRRRPARASAPYGIEQRDRGPLAPPAPRANDAAPRDSSRPGVSEGPRRAGRPPPERHGSGESADSSSCCGERTVRSRSCSSGSTRRPRAAADDGLRPAGRRPGDPPGRRREALLSGGQGSQHRGTAERVSGGSQRGQATPGGAVTQRPVRHGLLGGLQAAQARCPEGLRASEAASPFRGSSRTSGQRSWRAWPSSW